jgi:DNA-binding beta-propeller fold protein YncE
LAQPRGVAVDPLGNVYIADTENSRILELSAGALVDIAGTGPAGYSGDGGPSSAAGIARPTGITLDNAGNVYFSDHDNGVVRILTPAAMLVSMARASKLSGAIAHLPFKRQLSAILGVAPYRWSLISGTLPAGLALSPGGTITGTPTSSGMFQGIWAWVRRWFLRNEPNSLCRLVQVFRISKIREI